MTNVEMLLKILPELKDYEGKHKEGVSSYDLSIQIGIPEQKLRYHLKKYEEEGLILKKGRLFSISGDVALKNGYAILHNIDSGQFDILGCPHYGKDCPCTGNISLTCLLLKDLKHNPVVKNFLKSERKKKHSPLAKKP